MSFSIIDDGLLVPPHRVILDVHPQWNHVIVMRVVSVTRLAGGVRREGGVEDISPLASEAIEADRFFKAELLQQRPEHSVRFEH